MTDNLKFTFSNPYGIGADIYIDVPQEVTLELSLEARKELKRVYDRVFSTAAPISELVIEAYAGFTQNPLKLVVDWEEEEDSSFYADTYVRATRYGIYVVLKEKYSELQISYSNNTFFNQLGES